MGIIRRLDGGRERLKIVRFRARQGVTDVVPDFRAWWALLIRQLLFAATLLVATTWIDRVPLPHLVAWLGVHLRGEGLHHLAGAVHLADASTLGVVLTTDVAVAAGIAAIVIGASMVLFDSAAQRYPASAVDYLAGERSRGVVVQVLIAAISYGLLALLLQPVGVIAVLTSILLTLLSLVALVRYLQHATMLFHPAGLSRRLVAETHRRISAVATLPARGPGRSVSYHLQRQTAADLGRLADLLQALGDERKNREISDVVALLGALLDEYLRMRRGIPADSMWFPLRNVVLADNEVGLEIRRMHEGLGLGAVQGQRQDHQWFERAMFGIFGTVASAACVRGDHAALNAVVDVVAATLPDTWRAQEIDALEGALDLLDRTGRDAPDAEIGTIGIRLVNAWLQLADTAAREGFALSVRPDAMDAVYTSDAAVYRLRLPTILQRLCLAHQERLGMERAVSGRQVTPREWSAARLDEQFKDEEGTNVRKVVLRTIRSQQDLVRRALAAGLGDVAGAMFAVGPQLGTRLILHGRHELAGELFPGAFETLPDVLEACAAPEARAAILTQIRVPTLQAIARQDCELAVLLIPALVRVIASGISRPEGVLAQGMNLMPEFECLLVLGGIAYLASEFTQDGRYLETVKQACAVEGLSLAKVAGLILPLLDGGPLGFKLRFGQRLIFGYHDVFLPYIQAIHNVPQVADKPGDGEFGWGMHADHPSMFIRRAAMHLQYDDCVEAFLQDVADPSAATA